MTNDNYENELLSLGEMEKRATDLACTCLKVIKHSLINKDFNCVQYVHSKKLLNECLDYLHELELERDAERDSD